MSRSLWTRLVLPLAAVSIAFIAAHAIWDYDGFFLNLSAGLLTIIVTVSYVDWILKQQDSSRWSGTDSRVSARLEVFENGLISGIRVALGFGPDVMDDAAQRDPHLGHLDVLRVAEYVLSPAARARVDGLDESGWVLLSRHLELIWGESDRLLDRFANRLSPRQTELLLDIQLAAQHGLTFYQTFPDLAGVPPERLPTTRTPPEILQSVGYDSTAKELRKLLSYAVELADT